jgi:hypothetical protein
LSIERDHVDLAVAGAGVAGEDREAETLQVCCGQLLAEAAERVAWVFGRRVRVGVLSDGRLRWRLGWRAGVFGTHKRQG